MTAAFVITAGRAGGDFDAFIAHMGRPSDFGYESATARHVLMLESQNASGQAVEMVRGLDGFTQELMLWDLQGQVLLDIVITPIAYTLTQPASQADGVLDAMMNLVQSGSIGGVPRAFSFVGKIGNDTFTGLRGDDSLAGGGGQDALSGGGGSDMLAGGGGDDTLGGGSGADRLRGGSGADVFVFTGGDPLAASGDVIADFSMADADRIDLMGVDARAGNSLFDRFTFISTAFDGRKGEVRLEVGAHGTEVQGDVDGDGKADFIVTILNATDLDATALLL